MVEEIFMEQTLCDSQYVQDIQKESKIHPQQQRNTTAFILDFCSSMTKTCFPGMTLLTHMKNVSLISCEISVRPLGWLASCLGITKTFNVLIFRMP